MESFVATSRFSDPPVSPVSLHFVDCLRFLRFVEFDTFFDHLTIFWGFEIRSDHTLDFTRFLFSMILKLSFVSWVSWVLSRFQILAFNENIWLEQLVVNLVTLIGIFKTKQTKTAFSIKNLQLLIYFFRKMLKRIQ